MDNANVNINIPVFDCSDKYVEQLETMLKNMGIPLFIGTVYNPTQAIRRSSKKLILDATDAVVCGYLYDVR